MDALTVLGATGVVVAILANTVAVARYVNDRRSGRTRAAGGGAEVRRTESPAVAHRRSTAPAIRTPDQRVRVFVSSTLHELAAERAVARRAIESLRLTPVMFELGARPHPPRDLYRAYLAQSDVFVAIYAQRYGWTAPGETVSGLEDEYLLSAGMPKLVYVRAAEGTREAALQRLLDRVRADDEASYRAFHTAEELGELIGNDLSLLLSERFGRQPVDPTDRVVAGPRAPLPTALTSFVGRSDLLERLETLLQRPGVRLLTLYGPGGAGKTRVAIALAKRLRPVFDEDAIYVSLAAVREPELVATSLAIGLGIKETAGVTPLEAMRHALADRRGLLVIDDFEHVLDAAPVVADLVQAAPRLTVLVTSRSVLRLAGEVVYPIPPLALPEPGVPVTPEAAIGWGGVQLFVERARSVDPSFELVDANVSAVVEICRRVDALPLAIELAAARTRSLEPAALLARMTKRLPLLSGGPRDAPARQRTLRDTIDWSVALLTPTEQLLFGRLALFEGGATIGVIERVLFDHGDVLGDLSSLVDKSIVQRPGGAEGDRVVMLETVREYAAERLELDRRAPVLRDRHADVFLEIAERGAEGLKGPDQSEWQRLRRDLGNLRAAMARFLDAGASVPALRLATALRPFFMTWCHYAEGRRLLDLALAAECEDEGTARAAALVALGALAWRQGDLAAALAPTEESLRAYRAAGDRSGTADALRMAGVIAHNAGEYDLAGERLDEALALVRELGDAQQVANTLLSVGNVAFDRGESRARAIYEESRDTARRIGNALIDAHAVDNLAALSWCRSELESAERLNDEAAALYQRLDHQFGIANVRHRRGLLALARDDLESAEEHLASSLLVHDTIGDTRGGAFLHHDLGLVALASGRRGEARARFRAGLDLAERHGSPLIAVLLLEAVAAWLTAGGAHADAVELLAAAAAWRRLQRVPLCRVNRERHARLLAELERHVDDAARAEAEERGGRWSVVAAAAVARTALDRLPAA